jgi:prepilin-type N-terminal cleavage/methylation domain-containing protein
MKKGFTLIELMIVVAIIAIIAAIAIPNLLRSRMAANESAAVAACKTFAESEDIYRRTDWNADGVLEYATTLTGNYSLFETVDGSGDLQLIDQAFANAACTTVTPTDCTAPKAGYSFWLLTGQGTDAPGGARLYYVGTHMTIGYGLSASPYSWDGTGRNTFVINNTGTVYQSDRGASGSSAHETEYNPGTGWTPAE